MGMKLQPRDRQHRHSQMLIRSIDQHRLLIVCRNGKLIHATAHAGTLGKQKQQQHKKLASNMSDHTEQHPEHQQQQQQEDKKLASKMADHAEQHQEQQQQQQQQQVKKLAIKMKDHAEQHQEH